MLEDWRGIGVGKRSHGNFRQLRGIGGQHALRVWQIRSRGDAGRGWVSWKLEHESDRAALHSAGGTAWSLGIGVAARVAVVFRCGINDDSCRATSVRHEFFYAAEVLSVTNDNDLAAHIDVHLFEFVEVGGRAVVGIVNFFFDIARRRHSVKRRHDAWIVGLWIAIDMLAMRPMHFNALGQDHVDADLGRIVHPNFVFDDLGVESGLAKFLRDIVGGRFVFDASRYVRRLGEDSQMLFRQLGVGNWHKLLFDFLLGGNVAEAADGRGFWLVMNVASLIFVFAGLIKCLQVRTDQE